LSPAKGGAVSQRGAGAITRAFFLAADADGDGVINRDELVEAASALGLTPSETEMDALFRQ
jgi:Ca2+-binding EF-hand superfamily protein